MTNQSQAVPCGKCPACFKRRASAWSFRLMQEEKRSTSAYFITLTYDTDHVPITQKGFMGLDKNGLQNFFKRLRKLHSSLPDQTPTAIKYYAVGEYGSRGKRPHYHAIMFNAKLELIPKAWMLEGKMLGDIHYGTVTGASIGYTLKYMSKPKVHRPHWDDRPIEFALMSKGLGENYLTPAMIKWHNAPTERENRMHCTLEGGKKISMPRYYKQKAYHEDIRKAIGAAQRIKMVEDLYKKEAENPNYHEDKFKSTQQAFLVMNKNSTKNDKF